MGSRLFPADKTRGRRFRRAALGRRRRKFTGQERDAETGLDYFEARHYTSQFGRFLQPDPAGMAAVDPSNPQSWNQYAYVGGNPLNFTDPSGMVACQWWRTTYTNGHQDGPPSPDGISDCGDYDESEYLRYLAAITNGVSPFGLGFSPCMVDATANCDRQGGGGDPKIQQIENARATVYLDLVQDPDCLAFLGPNALPALSSTPIKVTGPDRAGVNAATWPTPNVGMPTSYEIDVNQDGGFFRGFGLPSNQSFRGQMIMASSDRFQAATLLHELGHVVRRLQYDGPGLSAAQQKAAQAANNSAIASHCASTLGRSSNVPQ